MSRGRVGSAIAAAFLLAGCSSAAPSPVPSAPLPASVTALLTATSAEADRTSDRFEVWICEVPLDTTDPRYEPSTLRLELTPAAVAAQVQESVPDYFVELSHGRYRPEFVAGGTITMTAQLTGAECLEAALDQADPASTAVLAVATAEHSASQSGGFGRAGQSCDDVECTATLTRRGIYLGASDFHPDWGDTPALDLLEHEIGHLLSWPHSGDPELGQYSSNLDVMSNSAALREVDPTARHGQDTLAINRLVSRWLAPGDVVVADQAATVALSPSTGTGGTRALILPVGDCSFLTVELLTPTGLSVQLPHPGVVVHRVEAACGDATSSPYAVSTVSGTSPFLDLLSAGSTWTGEQWQIVVDEVDETAVVTVSRPPD